MRLLIALGSLCTLLFTSLSYAESAPSAEQSKWSIGFNIGLGQRSTFITGQDDLDLYILPDVYYYSEHFFFDNGTLGYTLTENDALAVSVIAELNPYGLYFQQSIFGESFNGLSVYALDSQREDASTGITSDQNDFVVSSSPQDADLNNTFSPENLNSYRLPTPKLTADIGGQLNWFISPAQTLTFKALRELGDRHQGMRAKLSWNYRQRFGTVNTSLSLGFDWLDTKSTQYHFGLNPEQSLQDSVSYETGSAINPFIALTISYPINENLSLVGHVKYLDFDSAIVDSPVTNASSATTHFIGANWRF